MTQVIVDTGPVVAFLNKRDAFHKRVCEVLDTVEPPMVTCDAVLSEACFLLRRVRGGPDAVLELVARGLLVPSFRVDAELAPIRKLMTKFANVPMSLADACLVRMSELERDSKVLTLDSDFTIYRRNGRQVVPTIMPD